ncbi:Hypothetical protein FNO222_1439 [Francisella orientalis]|uniref:Uncharacterized protein n=1 Tax=Francisella orientalis TaxID=299583 RepID=A0ABM5U8D3_9GAMM|nr:hypothetical protein FNO12_1426 [Francisella orientalis FNO12]AKN87525.1 Hypothetical protein FNO24_1428 [Francisella orientalis FNO24]AKN89063.1 Hypothetical protein FNO190_1426 [Francisella orientalis]AKU05822.1 Hypothetical protein FNO01_1426 [Francisella orientalis]QEN20738.1 Hypothetical protein FNO39_1439 [Francisella orientalis]
MIATFVSLSDNLTISTRIISLGSLSLTPSKIALPLALLVYLKIVWSTICSVRFTRFIDSNAAP